MKCVIRRHGLYLSLHGVEYIPGTWTHHLDIARVFHTKREAIEFLEANDLPSIECEIVGSRDLMLKPRKTERLKAIRREQNRMGRMLH